MGVLEADLAREQDIEELRRIAIAQHAQIEQLIRQLKRKCDTLSFYTGNKDELQQTLALIDKLVKQAGSLAEQQRSSTPPSQRRRRRSTPARRRSRICRGCPCASSSTSPTARTRAAAASSSR